MPALIFGIYCPLCQEGHLLSSLGTKPIVRDLDEPEMEPTLQIVEKEELVLDRQGDVAAVSAVHAICGFCSGVFEIDVTVETVTGDIPEGEEPTEPGRPQLSLVPAEVPTDPDG